MKIRRSRKTRGITRWIYKNKLFEEARNRHSPPPHPLGVSANSNFINQQALFLKQVDDLAQRHTDNALSTLCDLSPAEKAIIREKYFEVYRIIIIPSELLRIQLTKNGEVCPLKEFRRLAMIVHPDKNNHPNSKVAFQKLYNVTKTLQPRS